MSSSHGDHAPEMRIGARHDAGLDDGHDAQRLRGLVSGDGRRALRPQRTRLDRVVPAPGSEDVHPRPLPRGGQCPPGPRRPDGGALRTDGGRDPVGGPRFDQPVPAGGYAWWYVDALSDDRRHGITIIAFVGSVFSPYYAWSGRANPTDHAALNVALYSPGRYRWTMTERRAGSLVRERDACTVGPSSLVWDGNALTIDVAEVSVPLPRRVTGRVRIIPAALTDRTFPLDAAGAHVWWPIAPRARIEVAFDEPGLSWTGSGYLDCNFGSRPLESDFARWDWSRADLDDGAAVLYDVTRKDGSTLSLGLRFDRRGQVEELAPPQSVDLPRAPIWRMPRRTQAEAGESRVIKTLEDTPFYARSVLETRLFGQQTTAVHESLSLDRFSSPLVKLLLPFRMPRARR